MILSILNVGLVDWQMGGQVAGNDIRGPYETFSSRVLDFKVCWDLVTENELEIIFVTYGICFLDPLNSLGLFITVLMIIIKDFSLAMHLKEKCFRVFEEVEVFDGTCLPVRKTLVRSEMRLSWISWLTVHQWT